MTSRKRKLGEDELHEIAIRQTGLDDFGDPSYRRGLRAFYDAHEKDLHLSDNAWRIFCDGILSVLTARLYTQKGWAEHPDALTTPIRRPLIIAGLQRTGSTALQRLLAIDPQFQGLETWLATTPMVRPSIETWQSNPVYLEHASRTQKLHAQSPKLRAAHDFSADKVDECGIVLQQNFMTFDHLHFCFLPTYAFWQFSQSMRETYQRYANVLRLIGARDSHKPWVLKSSIHMFEIDTVLEMFPDACIIQTHRDPLKAIPSCCSIDHMIFEMHLEDAAPKHETMGPVLCMRWRAALDRIQSARRRLPTRFLDVDHRRLLADPIGVVHSIYEHFGFVLSLDAEKKLRDWVSDNPPTRHGRHEYSVETWGITESHIRDTFADYRAQYHFT